MPSPSATISQWLKALNPGIDLALDANGLCAITCAADVILVVEVPKDSDRLLVNAALGPVPDDPDARYGLYRELLRQNLWQALASGGHFSLDDEAGIVVLSYATRVSSLDAAAFQALLEQACGAVVEARKQLGFAPLDDAANPAVPPNASR